MPEISNEAPLHESMSAIIQHGWNAKRAEGPRGKGFNIQRWLRSHVGDRWSDIYAILCKKKVKPFDHLDENNIYCLTLNCTTEDGKFFDSKGDEIKYGRSYRGRSPEEKRWAYGVVWKDGKVYANIKDVWYELELKEVHNQTDRYHNEPITINCIEDMILGIFIFGRKEYEITLLYGNEKFYAAKKRQLNKVEIKKLKLRKVGNEIGTS